MKVKCTECGKEYNLEKGENPSNYQCDCGGNLKSLFDIKKNRPQQTGDTEKTNSSENGLTDWWNKQSTNKKALMGLGGICCIGLIVILAIFAMGGSDKNTQNITSNPTTTTQTTTPTTQATWHLVTSFTGTGEKNTPSFSIKGNKFKVKMTATAATNATQQAKFDFWAYPVGETKSYVGQGSIASFSQSTMTDESEVTASPGNYYLTISTANLANWKTEIYDYY